MMSAIYNDQPVLGVRMQSDGAKMHNGRPVIGVVAVTGLFLSNQRVVGVNVLPADVALHNNQPVLGAVLISDGRALYNDQRITPVTALSGVLA